MSFRRIPFQFSATDPIERQRELEKRFGVPTQNKMFLDTTRPLTLDTGLNTNSSSPRLQHRVPIFVEGQDKPFKSSVDSICSAPENKKPNVRVIPIEIEGEETRPPSRHRTFSGPAGMAKQQSKETVHKRDASPQLKRSMEDLAQPSKMKATSGPRVYNIPIKVEGSDVGGKKPKSDKIKSPMRKGHVKVNGCDVSQHDKKAGSSHQEQEISEEERIKININNSIKKIESILEELKSYESGVHEFNGTAKDKQYRYLDEMLTQCMIRLDDIDTMGNDEIRCTRKNAVKRVQACIDLLEEKVNAISNTENVVQNDIHQVDTEVKDHTEMSKVLKCEDKGEKTEVNDVEEKYNSENVVLEGNKQVISTDMKELPQNDSFKNLNETTETEKSERKAVVDMLSEGSEVEMAELTSTEDIDIESPKEEVMPECTSSVLSLCGSTDVLPIENSSKLEDSPTVLSEPEQIPSKNSIKIIDSNEVEMTDVSSTQNNSLENWEEVAKPECSSTVLSQPVLTDLLSKENLAETTISQGGDEEMKDIKDLEVKGFLNCDLNQPQTVSDVVMKETVEDTAKTESSLSADNQCVLQSNCSDNGESDQNHIQQ